MKNLWKLGLLVVGVLSLQIVGVKAATGDLYAVDVMVDVADVNAAKAREKAMVAANRQAFISVLKKITSNEGISCLSALNDNQILNFVQEVSVISEKASSVRYIAELKVKFNEKVLKQYLAEKDIVFAEETGFRVLVVPVFRNFYADPPQLWEEGNLWRLAWEKAQNSGSSVEFITPEASGANYEMISAAKALELDASTMDWLARSYKADEVYVLDAAYDGIDGLQVKIYAATGKGGLEQTVKIPGNKGEQLMNDAVSNIKTLVAERIKRSNLAENQTRSEIMVLYEYRKMADWLQLQKELKQTPYIKEIREEAMGSNKVQFRLQFLGSPQRLEQILSSRRIYLQAYDGFYTIDKKQGI